MPRCAALRRALLCLDRIQLDYRLLPFKTVSHASRTTRLQPLPRCCLPCTTPTPCPHPPHNTLPETATFKGVCNGMVCMGSPHPSTHPPLPIPRPCLPVPVRIRAQRAVLRKENAFACQPIGMARPGPIKRLMYNAQEEAE